MSQATPKEILIAITYRCNARCHMCNIWQYQTHAQEEILPQHLVTLPNTEFCNITGGEPFTRREEEIEEFVRIMRKKAKRIVISTNGYYTEKIVKLAQKFPGLGIRVSIEGLPQTNDELRGLKDGFDHGIRTLLELHRLGMKDIGFGITLSDKNIMDLMPLYQLSKAMNLEFATACIHNTFYFHKFDNRINRLSDFEEELKALIADLLKSRRIKNWFRGYFNYGMLNFVFGKKRLLPCAAGKDLLFIDPKGNFMPCNGMEESMGNIRENSFAEIWNSPRAQEARRSCAACKKECWMIGSVAPAMKRNLAAPALWVAKNKMRLMLGKGIL
ncbi:MAG: radical SAM protein [Candidatus Omnitrophica bacterium]|nr:radical SAM protein [Candidatus Omnitrophota bacterium]